MSRSVGIRAVKVAVVPRQSLLSRASVPPSSAAHLSAMVRPRPVPGISRGGCGAEKGLAARARRSAAGMPMPRSLTMKTSARSRRSAAKFTSAPGGAVFDALARQVCGARARSSAASSVAAPSAAATSMRAAVARGGGGVARERLAKSAQLDGRGSRLDAARFEAAEEQDFLGHVDESPRGVLNLRDDLGAARGNRAARRRLRASRRRKG